MYTLSNSQKKPNIVNLDNLTLGKEHDIIIKRGDYMDDVRFYEDNQKVMKKAEELFGSREAADFMIINLAMSFMTDEQKKAFIEEIKKQEEKKREEKE